MRRTNRPLHHDPAQLRPLGRALVALGAAALVAVPGAALGQAPESVRLPTGRDAIAIVPGADQVLLGAGFEERVFPGRVNDQERVAVDLGADGAPVGVTVEHRLALRGQGDYSFRIPGPAVSVEALPSSESRPGLRRGSVIWQGFSPGQRQLDVRMVLYPEQEANRLPLRLSLSVTVDGRPLLPGERRSGPMVATLRLENVTAFPTRIADAEVDPAEAAAVLDAIAANLRDGIRPVPGRAGIPRSLAATGPVTTRSQDIDAGLRLIGSLRFVRGGLDDVSVTGGRWSNSPRGRQVSFKPSLGAGRRSVATVKVRGTAADLGLPDLDVHAVTTTPSLASIAPPEGAESWGAAVEGGLATDGRQLLTTAMTAMWRVARMRLFDAYIGNPDAEGSARTGYNFRFTPAVPRAPAAVVVPPSLGAFGVALAAIAAIALLFAIGLLWANA